MCLARYAADAPLIDACACDVIVTDCHVNAESAGAGAAENSAPFNVFNSAGLYDPPTDATQRAEWWNAASPDFAWRHECALHLSVLSVLSVHEGLSEGVIRRRSSSVS